MLDGLLVKLALGINPSDRNGIHARMKDWNLHLHGNEETDSSKELPKRIPDSGMNGDTEPEQSVV